MKPLHISLVRLVFSWMCGYEGGLELFSIVFPLLGLSFFGAEQRVNFDITSCVYSKPDGWSQAVRRGEPSNEGAPTLINAELFGCGVFALS